MSPPQAGIPDGAVVEVPMSQVDMEDTDLEFRVDRKIKDLVEDIRRNGQQFPVILRHKPDSEKYQLVSGFRRCRSLMALGWPTVKAIVRADLTDEMAYRLSFLENEVRKSLTTLDKAHAVAKLRLRGRSPDQVQEIYGIGRKQMSRYQKMSEFPDILQQAILEGRVEATHGLILLRAYENSQGKMDMAAWIQRSADEGLSVRKLARTLNSQVGRSVRRKRWMERTPDGGFRLHPMRFDPAGASADQNRKMYEKLREAVSILEPYLEGAPPAPGEAPAPT